MNTWMPAIMKNVVNMLGKRRNSGKGWIWASLLGVGVSAAAWGLGRNRDRNMFRPLRYTMNRMRNRVANQMPNVAAGMTEFADDLVPDTTKNN
ncbi:hypothetical protein [Ectobacillus sp. sgz5001026]|uniref:hypothetical protein n=1 Tax=Ectobacillus sp. sgz5001026 TaxID=3242473 RepID=UPI0036D2D68E